MSKLSAFAWLSALTALFLWPGCKNDTMTDPGTGQSPEKAAIIKMVQSDSLAEFELSDEDVFNDGGPVFDDNWGDDGSFAKTLTAIKPLRWGKRITDVVRNIDVVISGDTSAIATITKTF